MHRLLIRRTGKFDYQLELNVLITLYRTHRSRSTKSPRYCLTTAFFYQTFAHFLDALATCAVYRKLGNLEFLYRPVLKPHRKTQADTTSSLRPTWYLHSPKLQRRG